MRNRRARACEAEGTPVRLERRALIKRFGSLAALWRSWRRLCETLLPILRLQLVWKHRVAGRRGKQLLQGHQTLAQEPAGELARTGIHVNVATDAVQVQRQRIDEGLPRIGLESLDGGILFGAPQTLLQPPARLIDFAVRVRAQFFPQDAAVARLGILIPLFARERWPADGKSGSDTRPLPGPLAQRRALFPRRA